MRIKASLLPAALVMFSLPALARDGNSEGSAHRKFPEASDRVWIDGYVQQFRGISGERSLPLQSLEWG